MAFFAKSRRKLRTKNFEAHFHRKLRTLEKCSNVKKLRTTEPQPIFTGSYKKKQSVARNPHNLTEGLQKDSKLSKPILVFLRTGLWKGVCKLIRHLNTRN